MTEPETRYAQIEKEALATMWACERFTNYILGKQIQIETDHKPLIPLLNTKHLNDLMRFDYTISGKLFYMAETPCLVHHKNIWFEMQN